MRRSAVILFSMATLLSACVHGKNLSPAPSITNVEKASLEKRVNCVTAPQDIAALEEEKASVGRRALAGVRSVIPFSAAAGLLMGDYKDRVEVATGTYNEALEDKIREIQTVCGITGSAA
jgi:hypothetical protein